MVWQQVKGFSTADSLWEGGDRGSTQTHESTLIYKYSITGNTYVHSQYP